VGTGIVGVVAAIVAIVLASVAFREIKRSQGTIGGRGFAVAGLVLGIVTLGLIVVAVVIALIVAATIVAVCASCGSGGTKSIAGFAAASVVTSRAAGRPSWDAYTAHHPDHPRFDADVVHIHGGRVCLSCIAFETSF